MVKICQNCRKFVPESAKSCPTCGNQNLIVTNSPIPATQNGANATTPTTTKKKAKSSSAPFLLFLAIMFYIASIFMAYKGYDKMTNYRNPENSYSRSVNAYVGGDAYNYIINGNYATGFFVLSAGFLASGTLCVGFNRVLVEIS